MGGRPWNDPFKPTLDNNGGLVQFILERADGVVDANVWVDNGKRLQCLGGQWHMIAMSR